LRVRFNYHCLFLNCVSRLKYKRYIIFLFTKISCSSHFSLKVERNVSWNCSNVSWNVVCEQVGTRAVSFTVTFSDQNGDVRGGISMASCRRSYYVSGPFMARSPRARYARMLLSPYTTLSPGTLVFMQLALCSFFQ